VEVTSSFDPINRGQSSPPWVCFDFKEKLIDLTHYTVRCHPSRGGSNLTWEIEGSNDGSNWKNLDRRVDQNRLAPFSCLTYKCANEQHEYYRLIRMKDAGGMIRRDQIWCNLEFFGNVRNLKTGITSNYLYKA
jgi:hypothetical protein